MIESMEEIVELSLLFDFYGELLGEHKKMIFEDYVLNDLSLAEIAEEAGISRQGVHDIIKRCTKQLREYEASLHLAEKFHSAKERVSEIEAILVETERQLLDGKLQSVCEGIAQAKKVTEQLMTEL